MRGRTALVVEEEYLIAADIEFSLITGGAEKILIARNVAEANALDLTGIDLAIIEAKLGAPEVVAFAARLRERGMGVVVTSADKAVQSVFTGSVPLEKPFVASALLAACEAALHEARRPLDQV